MTEDARLYRVRWEIEVEAETPLEAAEKARHYQTKPGTTATVFEIAEIHPYAVRRYGKPYRSTSLPTAAEPTPRGAARARGRSVGASRPDGETGENSVHPNLAERQDRPHPRDDHGEGLVLDRLRALR